jgi:hypothetical protein
MRHFAACLVFVLGGLAMSPAVGQVTHYEQTGADGRELDVIALWEMTLTPAQEPTPALKYSLFPRYWERRNGDATAHYYRALLMQAELPAKLTQLIEAF